MSPGRTGSTARSLTVTVDDSRDFEVVHSEPEGRKTLSSFYGFCKRCQEVKDCKLRVHCSECKSNSVVLAEEPSSIQDVCFP